MIIKTQWHSQSLSFNNIKLPKYYYCEGWYAYWMRLLLLGETNEEQYPIVSYQIG